MGINSGREAQLEALFFIHRYQQQHGWSPSIREIAQGIFVSRSSAQVLLEILAAKGWIARGDYTPRAIRIIVDISILKY